jgi:hypothetical protein
MDIYAVMSEITKVVGALLASGALAATATQVLKLPYIKLPAERYPTATALLLSLIIGAVAVFSLHVIVLTTWVAWLVYSIVTLFAASKIYDVVSAALVQYQTRGEQKS